MASNFSFADQVLSPKALEQLLTTLSRVRSGDFNVRMSAQGDGMEHEVGDSVNELIALLAGMSTEIERVSEAVVQGELRARMPLDKANGSWGNMLRAINNVVVVFGKHVAELRRVTKALHAGDTSRTFAVGPETTHRAGELAKAAEDFNTMMAHVQQITSEITRVFAEVGLDGRLNAQCHSSDASGAWGLLVASVNAASASLAEQVLDLCNVSQAMGAGNLAARATVTSRGDLQALKLGLNGAAENLSALCDELRRISHAVCAEGKLTLEMRHPNPQGQWQSAQEAVNRMLTLLAGEWRRIAERAEQVLHGEYAASAPVAGSGELFEPAHGIEKLADQQQVTHSALAALLEGRFDAVPMRGDSQRDLTLMQLALRLKREYFRASRGSVLDARERADTLPEFTNMALSAITQAVSAAAGAYYSVEESVLRRSASIGCEPSNDVAPLRMGDGLVGKVAATGEPLLLADLQKNQVRVRSGLVELTPSALLIYPVRREERVVGVLELLFLEGSAVTAREFLEYLGEEMGRGPRVHTESAARVKELEEELLIANARIEHMSDQARERPGRAAAGGGA
ncbi:MAG TPA: GAF domain-containing protein [Polyangiales bacterium]|nr:GAF domain-containing protein [Polyangiales bacterium]